MTEMWGYNAGKDRIIIKPEMADFPDCHQFPEITKAMKCDNIRARILFAMNQKKVQPNLAHCRS